MLTDDQLARIDRAAVGVLGHITGAGRPNAVAVTPYVVDGEVVVTSTLAFMEKAAALRARPDATLTAGRLSVSGRATVMVDPTPRYFDAHLRGQELRKFPPAKSLTSIPMHRTLLWWYVGRVVMTIRVDEVTEQSTDDTATVTGFDHNGRLSAWSVARPADLAGDRIEVSGSVADGPALLLVHEEDDAMRDLRQLGLRGAVTDGVLEVSQRRGSLVPSSRSAIDEVRSLRTLAQAARRNRGELAGWPAYTPGSPSLDAG